MTTSTTTPIDFRSFLYVIWRHLNLPAPTKRQYRMARFISSTKTQRKVVMAWRGAAKSWITAAYVLWRLYHNPALNIVVVSASKQRADGFTTFVLRLINEIEMLQHLRPLPHQRQSMVAFDVGPAPPSQTPSVVSLGITSQITGNRGDLIVADDVEVRQNSMTQVMREKLGENIKEFEALLKPGGEILFLGTPQSEQTIYAVLRERGYRIKIFPARYPSDEEIDDYGDELDEEILREVKALPALVGTSTEPSRFTDADLLARELSYGRAEFARQFMLRTRLSDLEKYPLRLSDLLVMPLDVEMAPERLMYAADPARLLTDVPNVGLRGDRIHQPLILPDTKWLPYVGKVLAIDPAGRGKDETGYAVVGFLNGYVFLLDAGGLKGYGEDTLVSLAEIAKKWKVNIAISEPNFGDGMFNQIFQPVLTRIAPGVAIEEAPRAGGVNKERRIADTLEPVMTSHRMVVNKNLFSKDYESTAHYPQEYAFAYQLFYQLTRLTRDKGSLTHDDRLDGVAIGVAHWTESMAMDAELKAAEHAEALKDLDLQKFIDGIESKQAFSTVEPPSGPIWQQWE